ncbi:MAG: sigma-70 family RNA polymerase sigma factor [Proteobacteria bacterium]|nr:sigma-70 family RNA polymerase sigma factor [Pseudomonadota bacterium]
MSPRKADHFREKTEPHFDALYRVALRMTGNVEMAKDLVQETCLKAYRFRDGFESGTNYRAWLFRILMNTRFDELRRGDEPIVLEIDAFLKAEDAGAVRHEATRPDRNPETDLLTKAFRRDARRAISRLPPNIRAVVSLAVLEEFSYAEIAQVLNCPLGTVRSRLSRGREQLKIELWAYLDDGRTEERGRSERGSAAKCRK